MQGDGWIVIDYAHIFTAAIIGDCSSVINQ